VSASEIAAPFSDSFSGTTHAKGTGATQGCGRHHESVMNERAQGDAFYGLFSGVSGRPRLIAVDQGAFSRLQSAFSGLHRFAVDNRPSVSIVNNFLERRKHSCPLLLSNPS
jgi:hypothetical protein